VLVTFELPAATIRETIGAARRCGARLLVQPAPMLADLADAVSLPWDQVDILVPNEIEARTLLKRGHDLFADELAGALAAELGVDTVVVTLGASGCVAHAGGVTRKYPAQKTEVVDTTGASDAFTASLVAQLTAGAAEADAIRAAQSAAAFGYSTRRRSRVHVIFRLRLLSGEAQQRSTGLKVSIQGCCDGART
jgi:ribokinase